MVYDRRFAAQQYQTIPIIHAADLIRAAKVAGGKLIAVTAGTAAAAPNALAFGTFCHLADVLGQPFKGGIFVAAKVYQAVAVADHALPIILVQALNLAFGLQNNITADIAAAAYSQNVLEIGRQGDIGKLVHHKSNMDRQRAVKLRLRIRQPEKLVKKLGVQHRDEEVIGFVIVRDDTENHTLFQPQTRQEHGVGVGHFGKLRGIEHIQVGRSGDQHRLQRFGGAQLKAVELQHCRMQRVTLLQLIKKHLQGIRPHVALFHLTVLDHVHQGGKVLLRYRRFVNEIQDQRGNQQHRGIVPEFIAAAGRGVLGFCIVDDGICQLNGIFIGVDVMHGVIVPFEMHKVDHCDRNAQRFIKPAKRAHKLALGVQKQIRAAGLHGIRLYIKSGLAAAGAADDHHIQIVPVCMAVCAESDIL